jgi:hypothetical protein
MKNKSYPSETLNQSPNWSWFSKKKKKVGGCCPFEFIFSGKWWLDGFLSVPRLLATTYPVDGGRTGAPQYSRTYTELVITGRLMVAEESPRKTHELTLRRVFRGGGSGASIFPA